jgi:HlyD family secretion protein
MTRRALLVLGALALLAAGGWAALTLRPLTVTVAAPTPQAAVRVFGLGTVEAQVIAPMGFEVGAALVEVAADHGDAVAKGAVLARLNDAAQAARAARAEAGLRDAEAGRARAAAALARAEAVLAQRREADARQQALAARSAATATSAEESTRDLAVAVAERAIAAADLDLADARRTDAAAALAFERAVLEQHALRAPFDAVVVERHVEPGQVVRAGEPILTLMDPASVWALAYVDEARAGPIALGQPAEVRLRSRPGQPMPARVARIGIESDRVNEERRVWVRCERCPRQPHLGEQAEIRITVGALTDALLIPEIAVTGFDGAEGLVWAVLDGRLTQVPARFGARTEDARLELVGGLPAGAQVVVDPLTGLTEGRAARVREARP